MKGIVEKRAVKLGEYIIENQTIVHGAAKKFEISKSTYGCNLSKRFSAIAK